jgi:hypothetical protein
MSEVNAYTIASKSEELRTLVPTFFGVRRDNQVIDSARNDVSGEFYPDLCFEAEFFDCNFKKTQ